MSRAPFFNVDGEWYVDLTWNFDESVVIPTPEQFARLLESVSPDSLIVARAMTPAEVRQVVTNKHDIDAESFSFLMPRDELRWQPPTKKRAPRRRGRRRT